MLGLPRPKWHYVGKQDKSLDRKEGSETEVGHSKMTSDAQKAATSTELTGGAGFTYEDTVVAYYLAALLRAEPAAGLDGRVVSVAVQRDGLGHPMDDIVIEFEDAAGCRTLGLQAKRLVRVTAAPSNTEFAGIMECASATLASVDFEANRDAYGFIAEQCADAPLRRINRLIDWAKASPDGADFEKRFGSDGSAAAKERQLREELRTLAGTSSADEEVDFYRHFVALRLDGLTAGGARRAEIAARLQELLAVNQDGQEILLFDRLCRLARDSAGRAHKWTRLRLLEDLRGVVRLRVVPNYADDIRLLSAFSAECLNEITETIDDFHVARPLLHEKIDDALGARRLVNISGLPGCGKSVTLKRHAQMAASQGPILFLKSDRLTGKGWSNFAAGLGLRHSCEELLAEVSATGTATLFIDGIDRIPPDRKGVVTDLLKAIQTEPTLGHWKVLASSRDQGLEAYRAWFPASFYKNAGIGDVPVNAFSEAEAKQLAAEKPHLKPLLFGATAIREIARRPFFAGIIAEGVIKDAAAPQTEIDLINAWWARGGHDAPETRVTRQRALLDLAEAGVSQLGKGIPQRNLKDATFGQIQALEADKIIREDGSGSTYSFTHDIFFEWSFFRLLHDLGSNWRSALTQAGEPPLLGRVVGLLSQNCLTTPGRWTEGYESLTAGNLRPQWRREWLTAPPFSPSFLHLAQEFDALLTRDDTLLERALVWFQAQHTVPNPLILRRAEPTDGLSTIRAADLLGWPSDFSSWGRLLDWLMPHCVALPIRLIPHALDIFGVWQNALADIPNARSGPIVRQCDAWLVDLEASEYSDGRYNQDDKWYDLGSEARKALATQLRSLIIRAARAYRDPATKLFERAVNNKRMREAAFSDLMTYSPIMAEVAPESLVAVAKAELMEELPQERLDREAREQRAQIEALQKLRAKPESELSDQDRRVLDNEYMFFSHGSSHYDLDDIGIERHNNFYHPPSALHEPFATLFQKTPTIALQLVHDLANHAVRGWRQIYLINRRERGTPLPVSIAFPWGRQEFWGDWHVYCWSQGQLAPQTLECAFLALNHWAFKEIEKGVPTDDVIRMIVEGSECYAMLGLALTLALETHLVSEVSLPIVSCQRLWHHDLTRVVQEPTRDLDLFGLGFLSKLSGAKAEAKAFLDSRQSRKREVRQLAVLFALSPDQNLRERFKAALAAFPDDLPYELAEQRKMKGITKELRDRAENWAGLGDSQNYRRSPAPNNMVEIQYQSPKPQTEEEVTKLEEITNFFSDQRAYAWARQMLANNKEGDGWTLTDAITYARERDTEDMFVERHSAGDQWSQSAIAAIASCAVAFRTHDSADRQWGWSVMDRIMAMQEPERHPGSKISWHPALYLAVALTRDRHSVSPRAQSAAYLFQLTAYPLEDVVHTAFQGLFADKDEHIRWLAAQRALDLAQYYWPSIDSDGTRDNSVQSTARAESLECALANINVETSEPLTGMPPAWVEHSRRRRRRRDYNIVDEGWGDPNPAFDGQLAAKLFTMFPIEAWLQSDVYRDRVIAALTLFASWTADRIMPEWRETHRQRDRDSNLYEWKSALGELLARAAPFIDLQLFRETLLKPFLAHNDEALHVLSAFADQLAIRHVIDAPRIPVNTLELLDDCVERVIEDRDFEPDSYRAGEVSGNEMPRLIRAVLFVSLNEHCSGATRFANGDYAEVEIVMPLITRLVSAVGWSSYVMDHFLRLCDRAGDAYPIDAFAHQANAALVGLPSAKGSWSDTMLSARMAGIVQRMADNHFPLRNDQAQALLRILDALIDLGDRRSAALEQSEAFKTVQKIEAN